MGTTQGFIRKVMGLGRRMVAQVVTFGAIALLLFTTTSCAKPVQPTELISEPTPQPNRLTGQIAEVSPPETLESLKQIIDAYTPQVRILSPRPGEVLDDTSATVRLQVRGLPLFKDETYELGPHLHLFLDNEPYKAVYDLSEPITFENLSPGTHTLRVFASRPWHESFKNQGAFDQRTFHVVAPTPQNELNANAPLLSYSRPQGTYGAEPIMLDFYLTNAPLHMSAQAEANDDLHDWRIRCTVNDQSFVFDQWQPIWLKGFKPGRNWVQLELIDESGNPIDNRFNNTVRIIDYQPGGSDTLARLVRGELELKEVAGIIDPTYVPPAPPVPESALEPEQSPEGLGSEGSDTAPEVPEPQTAEPEAIPELPQPNYIPTPPEAEPAQPEPDTGMPIPAEPEDEARPNPFLLPEPSPESERTKADQFSAEEDSAADDLTEADRPAVEAPTAPDEPKTTEPETAAPKAEERIEEDRAKDGTEEITPPAEPFVPPVLPQPEALPEPVPVRPSVPAPVVPPAPEQSTPQAPKAKGLRDRLKQWRKQPEVAPKPVEPGPTGEESVPDLTTPKGLVSPGDEAAPEDTAPELPELQPDVVEPYTTAPSLTEPQSPPEVESPEADSSKDPDDTNGAVEQPRAEQPRVVPRSPLAPQVQPFI
ncbi:hypothetical protein IQ265_17785 [Nodosilinea sp. LEGE 06152]|uniref:hypothetical protein n=1 Tax=Nodosilinea sp. LEGE 06152 TaxID=2777966 RepID=UPI00188288B0|nr:hypothetical protein [Nodosilinea sp. LEGE 06152]MBE9158668.1 hypothetical protein [Nodosilinea sp. LEGE 06152]